MKKVKFVFILLVTITSCDTSDKAGDLAESEGWVSDDEHLYRNYNFNVVIDVEHLQRNDEYNYKYLINKDWDFNEEGKYVDLPMQKLIKVNYSYVQNESLGHDNYDRKPIDTIYTEINKPQLDSVYSMTSAIFKINPKNLIKDTLSYKDNFDGQFYQLSFYQELQEIEYSVRLTPFSDSVVFSQFNNLLMFIENLD